MSDAELIARLRELASFERGVGVMQDFYCGDEMVAAADRIEALTKQVREMAMQSLSDLGQAQDAYEELVAERAKLARALESLQSVIGACNQGRMIPRSGAGGMSIEANIRGSVYTGVPAWPIEEAITTLAEISSEAALNKGENQDGMV